MNCVLLVYTGCLQSRSAVLLFSQSAVIRTVQVLTVAVVCTLRVLASSSNFLRHYRMPLSRLLCVLL
jgi:hypothetical protein